MVIFFDFHCNQSRHFGLRRIKKWLDTKEWQYSFPEQKIMNDIDQKEIDDFLNQAALGLMLHV